MRVFLLCLMFGLFLSFFAHAEDAPVPQLPEVHKVIGETVEVRWPDGRVAQMYESDNAYFRQPIKLVLSSTSCGVYAYTECHNYAGLLVVYYELRWTQHPDPQKIGKLVYIVYDGKTKREVAGDLQLSMAYIDPKDPYTSGIPWDQFTCPNWNWLVEDGNLPTELNTPSIATEDMFQNPESGATENLTVTQTTNSLWQLSSDRSTYQMLSFKDYLSDPGHIGGALINGSTSSWTFQKDQNVCMASFKVDFSESMAVYAEHLNAIKLTIKPMKYQGYQMYEASVFVPAIDFKNPMGGAYAAE